MSLRALLAFLLSVALAGSFAQVNVPVNGPATRTGLVTAFLHATVHTAPGEVITNATLVIKDDRIVAVGIRAEVPKDAVVVDAKDLHIWPGLVEPYGDIGMPKGERGKEEKPTGAHFWNPAIRASTEANALFVHDDEKEGGLRAQGYTTFISHRADGIARGTGCAVLPAGRTVNEDIIANNTGAHFSFAKGSSKQDYPNSLMGSIALLRQAILDAQWYAATGNKEQADVDLAALAAQLKNPLFFEAANRNDVLRIAALGKEFGLQFVVRGTGDEYARLGDIIDTKQPLIIPLALPEAYDVEDPFEAMEVSLAKLKHWELAPANAVRIADVNGVFAFTNHGAKDLGGMWTSLRRMLRCGLDTTTALAALTTVPARLCGLSDRVGTLEPGKLANFCITSHHLFDAKNTIHETWVAGERFQLNAIPALDPRGEFDLNLKTVILKMRVTGEPGRPEAVVHRPGEDSLTTKASVDIKHGLVSLLFEGERFGMKGPVRLNGAMHAKGAIWDGQALLPGGEWIAWTAVRQTGGAKSKTDRDKNGQRNALDSLWSAPMGELWYPLGAYGLPMLPDTASVIFRHATVWTNGPQGILSDADVCISGGRIRAVGTHLDAAALFPGRGRADVIEYDATGKHLTCGIIDEHSHIAIERGVNEGSQAITAEVRIGDVIDPDDVDIYRDLAGGVTAVQLLHGSANPIGGQSALTKLRWGVNADRMRIAGADGFIKFALGENVKQSNWQTDRSRFPQTRMGVEQLMYDAFHRAREYKREVDLRMEARYIVPGRRKPGAKPDPRIFANDARRDLELEALAEILDGKRFITCHSYVQSEVSMLMDVADSMGFKVQTFTHILEGYKVAPRMKQHGVSASTFSDWWAYKMEVADAIPYNAALLNAQGVNTCINSDDAEMSRRLNQEAAKAMKYGGVAAEDAWKMVTLNTAKALRLDGRMGSVEVGKDADIVLWSTTPLSIAAKAEMTFVDGVCYFDAKRDLELREKNRAERERLITRMIAAKRYGAPTKRAEKKDKRHWECETIGQEP